MIKIIFAFLLFTCSLTAIATPITVDFDVDFTTGSVSSVTGSITYDAVDEFSAIDSLISADLTIGSHNFLLSEMSYASLGSNNNIIGVTLCSVSCISGDTNDFWVYWNRTTLTPNSFLYSLAGDGFNHISGNYTSFSVSTAEVPEPAPLALLVLGLAAIGLTRKKKNLH